MRAAASVLGWLLLVTAATYLWQGYHDQHWWTRDYWLSLLIPFAIVPLFVCTMWVPRRFEFTETHLSVQLPFRSSETVLWDDLEYYVWLEGIYSLQFRTAGALTFFPSAFSRREWRALKSFLHTTFPERKASGFVGTRLFRWRRNKT